MISNPICVRLQAMNEQTDGPHTSPDRNIHKEGELNQLKIFILSDGIDPNSNQLALKMKDYVTALGAYVYTPEDLENLAKQRGIPEALVFSMALDQSECVIALIPEEVNNGTKPADQNFKSAVGIPRYWTYEKNVAYLPLVVTDNPDTHLSFPWFHRPTGFADQISPQFNSDDQAMLADTLVQIEKKSRSKYPNEPFNPRP